MPKLTLVKKMWFDYDESSRLQIKQLLPGDYAQIQEKSSKVISRIVEDAGDQTDSDGIVKTKMDTVFEPNPNRRVEETLTRAIVGWEGFLDTSGKEMPCTHQNILKFHYQLPDLYLKVQECLLTFEEEEPDQEEAEKN